MFNNLVPSFLKKPLNYASAVDIMDFAAVFSFVFIALGLTPAYHNLYFYMEFRNSLIAGGL